MDAAYRGVATRRVGRQRAMWPRLGSTRFRVAVADRCVAMTTLPPPVIQPPPPLPHPRVCYRHLCLSLGALPIGTHPRYPLQTLRPRLRPSSANFKPEKFNPLQLGPRERIQRKFILTEDASFSRESEYIRSMHVAGSARGLVLRVTDNEYSSVAVKWRLNVKSTNICICVI